MNKKGTVKAVAVAEIRKDGFIVAPGRVFDCAPDRFVKLLRMRAVREPTADELKLADLESGVFPKVPPKRKPSEKKARKPRQKKQEPVAPVGEALV